MAIELSVSNQSKVNFQNATGLPSGNAARTHCYWATFVDAITGNDEIVLGYGAGVDQEYSCGRHLGSRLGILRGSGRVYLSGTNSILPDNLYHIAIVSDGKGDHTGYINGVAQLTGSRTLNTTQNVLRMGRRGANNTAFVSAKIEDLRIYDRALSGDEIKSIYNSLGQDGIREGLVFQPVLLGAPVGAEFANVRDVSALKKLGLMESLASSELILPSSAVSVESGGGFGESPWVNPHNAATVKGAATNTIELFSFSDTEILQAEYSFSIPAGAIIKGIEVLVNRTQTSGNQVTWSAWLSKGSVLTLTPSNTSGTINFGGPTNLFGTTWTVAEVNDTDFQSNVTAGPNFFTSQNQDISIVWVQTRVYHAMPTGLGVQSITKTSMRRG